MWPNVSGCLPRWPDGQGKRVFAYIKPFPALPRLLQQLCDLQCPTIVHGEGLDENLRQRFHSATMRFEDQPLDVGEVGRTCDLAILNGNHGTTVSMLLAGKPSLQLPIALEQALFSLGVARLGAAVVAMPNQPREAVAARWKCLTRTSTPKPPGSSRLAMPAMIPSGKSPRWVGGGRRSFLLACPGAASRLVCSTDFDP